MQYIFEVILHSSSLNEKANLAVANENLASEHEWYLNEVSLGNNDTTKHRLYAHHLPHTKSDCCAHVIERLSVLNIHQRHNVSNYYDEVNHSH